MFGLTFEKLLLVLIVAAVIIGPHRLPEAARQVAGMLKGAKQALSAARSRAEQDLGVSRAEWEALDLRRYDPRRIVRDAVEPTPTSAATRGTPQSCAPQSSSPLSSSPQSSSLATDANRATGAHPTYDADLAAEVERIRPGQKFLVTGSAAHPRRVAIASLPESDPRRIAAGLEPVLGGVEESGDPLHDGSEGDGLGFRDGLVGEGSLDHQMVDVTDDLHTTGDQRFGPL